jgi:signal transduction histidine kinase
MVLAAFLICGLLIAYQLAVTVLQPPWIKPATDWLRAALAWPQFLVVAWVAWQFSRTAQRRAIPWDFAALALLSYAVARTSWTIADHYIYPHGVPFPSLPDLFFILQYPAFFAALFLAPWGSRWLPGLRILVDAVLWMSAVTALSWYFVLAPLSRAGGESVLSRRISIGCQLGDLVLLYALVAAAMTWPRRSTGDRLMLALLGVALVCLFVADTWAAVLLARPPHVYPTGHAPDLFWFAFYLLVPLAGVVKVRLAPGDLLPVPVTPSGRVGWRDLRAGVLFVLPSVVVVGAAILIMVNATMTSPTKAGIIAPEKVAIALLLLAMLRPAVLYVEREQLRREREAAHVEQEALRATTRRMEAFITVAAHELKTPLTSLVGNVQLMAIRLDRLLGSGGRPEEHTPPLVVLRRLVESCEHSLGRMVRLVEDLLDEGRIREGRLALRTAPCDLAAVVGDAVREQALLHPERAIVWVVEARPVPVVADASRIEQVVANYLSNALKFSGEDQPVEVRLGTEDARARVAVRDAGTGLAAAEQERVWERFHQAEGSPVQSGSRVGLGIGLYINREIVERHGGQVGVESAVGEGSTFWFTLPLALHSPSTAPRQRRADGDEAD